MIQITPKVMVTPPMLADTPDIFQPLRDANLEVIINAGEYPMEAAQLAACLQGAGAAIVGLDTVTADVFSACPDLRILARNGVGMDNVDMAAANAHRVLTTVPLGANSTSVAELAFGLMITMVRGVVSNHNRVQGGIWKRIPGMELDGKTLGIIGLGRIGKKVARRALAFNMQVIAHDIQPDFYFAREHHIRMVPREELLATADVVSLHVPLTPLTQNMMNMRTFRHMKRGAYLVNTARGAVVDTRALVAALESGLLQGAALDVHPMEGAIESILQNRQDVITTTHLGAYTHQSLRYTAEMAVDSILQILRNQQPYGLINPEIWNNDGD